MALLCSFIYFLNEFWQKNGLFHFYKKKIRTTKKVQQQKSKSALKCPIKVERKKKSKANSQEIKKKTNLREITKSYLWQWLIPDFLIKSMYNWSNSLIYMR